MRWLLSDVAEDDDAFVAVGADVEIGEGAAEEVDEARTELVAECLEDDVDDEDVGWGAADSVLSAETPISIWHVHTDGMCLLAFALAKLSSNASLACMPTRQLARMSDLSMFLSTLTSK